jgi:hypothetical protein
VTNDTFHEVTVYFTPPPPVEGFRELDEGLNRDFMQLVNRLAARGGHRPSGMRLAEASARNLMEQAAWRRGCGSMHKAVNVLVCIIFGAIGFSLGMAGHPAGWVFVLVAAGSIVATIRRKADVKDDQAGSNSWFDIGGCAGCGGGCGCGD